MHKEISVTSKMFYFMITPVNLRPWVKVKLGLGEKYVGVKLGADLTLNKRWNTTGHFNDLETTMNITFSISQSFTKNIIIISTLHHYNVIITPLWRHYDVIMTTSWRHYDVTMTMPYPCSRVINLAISVLLALISSWYFNIICWRERIEVFFHDWKALADDSATASISDKGWTGTKETTSWVAGFLTSIHSVAAESFQGTLSLPTYVKVAKSATFSRSVASIFLSPFLSIGYQWDIEVFWQKEPDFGSIDGCQTDRNVTF